MKEKPPEEEVTPGYKRLYADRSLAGPHSRQLWRLILILVLKPLNDSVNPK